MCSSDLTEDCEIQGALVVIQQAGRLPIERENGDLTARRDGVKALNHGEASKEVVAVEEGRVHQVLSRRYERVFGASASRLSFSWESKSIVCTREKP